MTEAAAVIEEVVNDTAQTTASTEVDAGTTATTETAVNEKAGDTKTVAETTETAKVEETAKEEKVSALPDNWRELASGGDKDLTKLLERYGDMSGVAKALSEAQKTIRAGVKRPEMPDQKDEKAMAAWRKDQDIPPDPAGYAIPEPIAKRLIDADKPILSNFTEFAHSKNLPSSAVASVTEWYVEMSEQAAEAQNKSDETAKEAAEDALRESWSRDEYKGNLKLAQRFLEGAGGIGDVWTEARLPDGRLLGSIPQFVQWASDMGRTAFGDVVFSSTDAENAHTTRRAEIEKIRDTDFDRYEHEKLDVELRGIIDRDLKRGKR